MGTRTYSRKGVLTALGRRRAAAQTGAPEVVAPVTPEPAVTTVPVPVAAPTAPTALDPFTATDEDRTRFAVDSTAQAARPFAPADVQQAWNSIDAAQLEGLLPANDAAVAISRVLQMPTPREAFGRGGPERGTFSNRAKKILREALGGAGTGYSELRRSLGIDGFPAATDIVSRRASNGKRAVGALSKFVKTIPAGTPADVKARVTAIADTMAGLALAKERIYETMILSRGGATPKGRVLSRVNNQITSEARRMANEINRLMGVPGRGTGLPAIGSPGRDAYTRLVAKYTTAADRRTRVGRGSIPPKMSAYSDAELSILNND